MYQEKTEEKKKTRGDRKERIRILSAILFTGLLALGQLLALELSVRAGLDMGVFGIIGFFFTRPWIYTLTAVLLILLADSLLMLLTANVGWSLAISSLLSTALAITNHFVFLLHGTPFTFSMMANTGTALNVLGSYELRMDTGLAAILLIGFLGMVAAILFFRKQRVERKRLLIPAAVLLLAAVVNYLIPHSVIPGDIVSWSWDEAIVKAGYFNCLAEETVHGSHAVLKPESYDETKLRSFVKNYQNQDRGSQTPDVILILNETLCDLRRVSELEEDRDFFSYIYSLPGARVGYAVVPGVGGGTNRSEYELLTGNSLQTAPNATPFNSFRMDCTSSVVTALEALGYETQAIHSEAGKNYNRLEGYPKMGFDTCHFVEDFEGLERVLGRMPVSDASVFRNMFRWYEQMGDGPRFFYTLTIQNHGGYSQMDPADYLVHVGRDFGDLTPEINEYLSSVLESDRAFQEIVEYFSRSDRDVVVCMVGDHGPAFIRSLADRSLSQEEQELSIRTVPYVIWSNHLDLSGEIPQRISMNYLVPTALRLAEIPLSPYFDYLLNLRDQVPVLGAYGSYRTADGSFYRYGEEGPYQEQVDTGLGISYASITGKEFMQAFSLPRQP